MSIGSLIVDTGFDMEPMSNLKKFDMELHVKKTCKCCFRFDMESHVKEDLVKTHLDAAFDMERSTMD